MVSSELFGRKKAAAEGAVVWCTKQLVVARAARATYGVEVQCIYDEQNPVHRNRSDAVFSGPAGDKVLDGFFIPLVTKASYCQELEITAF